MTLSEAVGSLCAMEVRQAVRHDRACVGGELVLLASTRPLPTNPIRCMIFLTSVKPMPFSPDDRQHVDPLKPYKDEFKCG